MSATDDPTPARRQGMRPLVAIAAKQGGYLTTSQARDAGVSRRMLVHYLNRGDLSRNSYGIYQVLGLPQHPFGDVIAACLWAGPDVAAASMETALAVHGLSDAMPSKVHITMPERFTGRRKGVVVHTAALPQQQRVIVDDVPVTSVARTLVDMASRNRLLARQAADEALDRGMVGTRAIRRAAEASPRAYETLLEDGS